MDLDTEDLIAHRGVDFAGVHDETELFEIAASMARELGFEHCSYVMRIPLPISDPRFLLFSNYPGEWVDEYMQNDYFNIDPTVQHWLQGMTPLIWSAKDVGEAPSFWGAARTQGLRYGSCTPSRGRYGTIGLLSLVRGAEPISQSELARMESALLWLSTTLHGAMTRQVASSLIPEASQALTVREKEALKWTAAGKTYSEIGQILSIDGRTVKFHLVNAMRKLGASNKAEAVVKALVLGFLY
jgi:LuxR family transcriptional regulator